MRNKPSEVLKELIQLFKYWNREIDCEIIAMLNLSRIIKPLGWQQINFKHWKLPRPHTPYTKTIGSLAGRVQLTAIRICGAQRRIVVEDSSLVPCGVYAQKVKFGRIDCVPSPAIACSDCDYIYIIFQGSYIYIYIIFQGSCSGFCWFLLWISMERFYIYSSDRQIYYTLLITRACSMYCDVCM